MEKIITTVEDEFLKNRLSFQFGTFLKIAGRAIFHLKFVSIITEIWSLDIWRLFVCVCVLFLWEKEDAFCLISLVCLYLLLTN